MKEKLFRIIEAIVIIVFGVIIAIFGGGAAIDLYFAIVCLVGGIALLVLDAVSFAKTKALLFDVTFLSVALITIGSGLLAHYISFAVLINLIVLLLLALGIAFVIYGIFTIITKKGVLLGVGQIIIGVAIAVLAILYMTVPEFQAVFWIIVGIVVAIYGVIALISALLPQKKKEE